MTTIELNLKAKQLILAKPKPQLMYEELPAWALTGKLQLEDGKSYIAYNGICYLCKHTSPLQPQFKVCVRFIPDSLDTILGSDTYFLPDGRLWGRENRVNAGFHLFQENWPWATEERAWLSGKKLEYSSLITVFWSPLRIIFDPYVNDTSVGPAAYTPKHGYHRLAGRNYLHHIMESNTSLQLRVATEVPDVVGNSDNPT